MFWWKNKNKVEQNIKVGIELVKVDGVTTTVLDIDKSLSPRDYIRLVMSMLSEENIRYACDLLEMNEHKNAYEQIQEEVIGRYTQQTAKLIEALNVIKMEEEIVKPSQGITE